MKKQDPALSMSNPRILAAIYFGLLSVVGTIIINAFLDSIGVDQIIPVFQAVILGIVVAACSGAVFGESIVHCKKPYKSKTFWLGFSMVIASLPLFDLGLLLFMSEENAKLFSIAKFHDLVYFYLVILAYSYILFGIVLAIIAGFAAMYLRGQLVYDILHTQERRKRVTKPTLVKTKVAHPHKVHTTHR
ncbi:hypothetical protein [Legionella bononiensis]|uniref:Transmembrane protein n=1 Tax=Legionella bononiensis TaxID=2793102 RepID=A0ABS1WAG9_9GAMM|nr:hypothetical protein [Legionella bononiensis]MBL7480433.1 hypothetical protein [Legionella bononiensis]MBL7526333.1 hypothetical protein [Legionella bononiensis]MBL7563173.1 hypothetical protein [Legionella bononiensis]